MAEVKESSLAPQAALRRARTVVKAAQHPTKHRPVSSRPGQSCYHELLSFFRSISSHLKSQETLLHDFLAIPSSSQASHDAPHSSRTLAEVFDMDSYFKRQANEQLRDLSLGPLGTVTGALGMIYGFLQPEIDSNQAQIQKKDSMSVFLHHEMK